jgi:hypothetical protein
VEGMRLGRAGRLARVLLDCKQGQEA